MLKNRGQGPSSFQVAFSTDQKSQKIDVEAFVHSSHRFVKHPEYLKEGQRLVFREGRTKAVGNVNKVVCNKMCQIFHKEYHILALGTLVLCDNLHVVC